jgi:NAD(P)-dependent dehydrogenase (short-subunit alcohol dehydrogenase family)
MSITGELEGKVAIVTGAAGGIGAASARALAVAGASVVVADLNFDGAQSVAEALEADGWRATAVAVDTASEEQIAAMVDAAAETFGGLDILHNNAAATAPDHLMRDGAIHELDAELWDKTMAVNLRGYMLGVKLSVPRMLERGGGVIVNTASGAGLVAELMRPAYGTSKAAVVGFTRNVATQYGKQGIRCVAIAPGLILTPALEANMPPPALEAMQRHFLTPRLGLPEDVANAVVFLASDRAGFITGVTVAVDGGFSVHTASYADELAMVEAMHAPSG